MPSEEDFEVPPMINALVESVKKKGPMVLEVWECQKCKFENFCFHHFEETLRCEGCGHFRASKVGIYLSVREKLVDES